MTFQISIVKNRINITSALINHKLWDSLKSVRLMITTDKTMDTMEKIYELISINNIMIK